LKPADDTPAQSVAWRPYEVLHYRYVQQCSQEEVADQLGLSVRQLKREQRKALEVLAESLREKFDLAITLGEEPEPATRRAAPETLPDRSELEWLEQSPPAKPARLSEVIPAVFGLVDSIAGRYHVHLQVDAAEPLPALAVHAVALRQILLSLLYVGIRRVAGGTLSVSARSQRWHVEVEIHGDRSQRRAPPSEEDEANLAMARQMVNTCSGSLELAEAPGFAATLTLPAAEQLPVLVIDDNLDALRLLQRYASGTRYRIVGTRDPEQAFSLASENRPQIIVLDVMMPEVDGWEVLGRLKQHPLTSGIPIIACTILAQEELALSLGVTAFLHKPVSRRDFLAALDRVLPLLEA
ncbi:MAG: response regulator, partial [Anaerolineae bacterium]|nr:response regulator [Anaerolineae bacterium]